MFSKFVIERPILANVIAIITILVGAVAAYILPVEQYPNITPPTVQVSTVYPGADATILANTVAAPIEQEVNGVEKMLYMSSTSASDGSYNLTITFEVGTDLNMAQVLVQNRVAIAMPKLPQEVQRQGVTTKKKSTSIILVVALTSDVGEYDSLFLSNYASRNVKDELGRIPGVGDINVFGSSDYGMRVWLDPEKLKARNLTTLDVVRAIQEQNVQVAAGQIGAPPVPTDQNFQYTVTTRGRLTDPEEFGDIIIKAETIDKPPPGGRGESQTARLTRVRDVARVERGAKVYDQWCDIGGKPAAGIAVYQLPGANALDVAKRIREKMEGLKRSFPKGLEYSIPFNTTQFVEESIGEVYQTLIEAGILVLVVILLFLEDWRATLVPATTVPVTIVGAFAVMYALGFTINTLTLFGLVLAIGIVVDDAIVIVENASHHIQHGGLDPKSATIKAMGEVIGPVIGITLVLMAVFLPASFLGGITGQLFRQFALTIAATAVISAINAVTLKPAQCATYLQPERDTLPPLWVFAAIGAAVAGYRWRPEIWTGAEAARWAIPVLLGAVVGLVIGVIARALSKPFFRAFNAVYNRTEAIYAGIVGGFVRWPSLVMLAFAGLLAVTGWWFLRLPTGFLPTEDKGYAVVGLLLPDAASQARTRKVVEKVEEILKSTPGVATWVLIGGNSVLDGTVASNAATFYVPYKPWEERAEAGETQEAILGHLRREFAAIQESINFAFPPPAIDGLGVTGGFQMQIEDRGGVGLPLVQQMTEEMIGDGGGQSSLRALNTTFRAGVPQLYADIDRVKAKSLGVPLDVVFGTLQAYLGSAYVNDFNYLGRVYQVRLQAEQPFRLKPADVSRLEVRDLTGNMLPMGSLAEIREVLGPQAITRYNLYPSAAITGEPAPGFSSGQALQVMETMALAKLPAAMGFDWTGMAYQEKSVGGQAVVVFGLAVLLVYLVMAGLYESWLTPVAVILVVPLALLGTVAALAARGMDVNIYTQVGIVLIVALASKNAILIVEFARELRAKGQPILDAAATAARMRFRPILMTSFAFILGIVPLVIAEGAGASSRRALGTAVFGGMIAGTILAVFFVPVFYVLTQRLSEWLSPPTEPTAAPPIAAEPEQVAAVGPPH